jgi:excisionase family DNA binding protein
MKTFDIPACADFLKIHRTTVLKLAATGELPGAKIGRAWVFLESDLVDYLRGVISTQQTKRVAPADKSPVTAIEVAPKRRSGRKIAPDLTTYVLPNHCRAN